LLYLFVNKNIKIIYLNKRAQKNKLRVN